MVGLAEVAAAKTMVRSFKGIKGAFAVETVKDGKNGIEVQLEGSCFETVWQLKEGGNGGMLDLNKASPIVLFFLPFVFRFLIQILHQIAA